jgi:MFS family permease
MKQLLQKWPYSVVSIITALAAFGAYTSMYAFRKAFSAATFEGLHYLNVDYKVWLVIFQVLGYTCSKFYGIRFIAGIDGSKRGKTILFLIGIAWLALLFFALIPAPWNIIFLFVNGFPLGMIWGLVFGYLEGRRATEFMAAVLSVSLIFASGFIKTVGRTLLSNYRVTEYWMPFLTGLLFVIPLVFFTGILDSLPPPSEQDKQLRTERKPMTAADRQNFVRSFLPGIILTLIIYILLTVTRDLRDNFEVEIWNELGIKDVHIYATIDSLIAIVVLVALSLLILIKNNFSAFKVIHLLIITGCILTGGSTWLFSLHYIGSISWMSLAGLGLYMGYIPYNAIFFERMIATYHCKGNVGFIMYIADAAGYLGSISVLLFKEFGGSVAISWSHLFQQSLICIAVVGGIAAICSLAFFVHKKNIKILPV